jgi:hypothetical protein
MTLRKSTSFATALLIAALLGSTAAWANRNETVGYLFSAALDQGLSVYYGGVGYPYYGYTYSNSAYSNLYNAYLSAPIGSSMEYYASLAQSNEYYAQLYWYYTYLYGNSYESYAQYYSYQASYYTAYAQYFAAFNL